MEYVLSSVHTMGMKVPEIFISANGRVVAKARKKCAALEVSDYSERTASI